MSDDQSGDSDRFSDRYTFSTTCVRHLYDAQVDLHHAARSAELDDEETISTEIRELKGTIDEIVDENFEGGSGSYSYATTNISRGIDEREGMDDRTTEKPPRGALVAGTWRIRDEELRQMFADLIRKHTQYDVWIEERLGDLHVFDHSQVDGE